MSEGQVGRRFRARDGENEEDVEKEGEWTYRLTDASHLFRYCGPEKREREREREREKERGEGTKSICIRKS